MKFFIPGVQDDAQAERLYEATAKFVDAPTDGPRVWKLYWVHEGRDMYCEVGKPLPGFYKTGNQPVIAIYDYDSHYKICVMDWGFIRGAPVLAKKNSLSRAVLFDPPGR